jgi:hypothetical protein
LQNQPADVNEKHIYFLNTYPPGRKNDNFPSAGSLPFYHAIGVFAHNDTTSQSYSETSAYLRRLEKVSYAIIK